MRGRDQVILIFAMPLELEYLKLIGGILGIGPPHVERHHAQARGTELLQLVKLVSGKHVCFLGSQVAKRRVSARNPRCDLPLINKAAGVGL